MASRPPDDPSDDRSALAIAYTWAWQIMLIALEMVIPGVLGKWIDDWLGTKGVFVILGFAGGMALGVWHLIRIARDTTRRKP